MRNYYKVWFVRGVRALKIKSLILQSLFFLTRKLKLHNRKF